MIVRKDHMAANRGLLQTRKGSLTALMVNLQFPGKSWIIVLMCCNVVCSEPWF